MTVDSVVVPTSREVKAVPLRRTRTKRLTMMMMVVAKVEGMEAGASVAPSDSTIDDVHPLHPPPPERPSHRPAVSWRMWL